MKWTTEAEIESKKIPFFVRKKVKSRVEKEATAEGKSVITLAEVKATQKRYLLNMSSEINGFQLDTCFGQNGCPNIAVKGDVLLKRINDLFEKEDLLSFLKKHVKGNLKFHHEFRVTIADCPNACSQPQIKDIGIIGACAPKLTDETCILCGKCVDVCKEKAILTDSLKQYPVITSDLCLMCGKCIEVCPTKTISMHKKGFRVQIGGKLGRHPQLAKELSGIFNEDEVIEIVKKCIDFYKTNSCNGERFAEILKDIDMLNL